MVLLLTARFILPDVVAMSYYAFDCKKWLSCFINKFCERGMLFKPSMKINTTKIVGFQNLIHFNWYV